MEVFLKDEELFYIKNEGRMDKFERIRRVDYDSFKDGFRFGLEI